MRYKGHLVGVYLADILVENKILIEIKARQTLHPMDAAQLLNYLSASGLRIGYLVTRLHPQVRTLSRQGFLCSVFYVFLCVSVCFCGLYLNENSASAS